MKKPNGVSVVTLLLLVFQAACFAAESTTIEITDDVRVEDCNRLGSGFMRARLLKKILSENFEGYLSRDVYAGTLSEDGFLESSKRPISPERFAIMEKFFVGAKTYVVSGPAKGERREIAAVEKREGTVTDKRGKEKTLELAFFVFDKPIDIDTSLTDGDVNPYKNNGLMIEKNDPSVGTLGVGVSSKISDEYYAFEHDDLPPGSTGKTALLLKPAVAPKKKNKLHLGHNLQSMLETDCNRVYKIRFWAKAASGDAKVRITTETFFKYPEGKAIPENTVTLTPKWEHYELDLDFTGCFPGVGTEKAPLQMQQIRLEMTAVDGEILIDDVELEGTGYKNPTRWVDEAVEALKFANLGIIRRIGMHRPSVTSSLAPLLSQVAYTRFIPQTLGAKMSVDLVTPASYFELAEYLDVEAYYCLPQATTCEEIEAFLEYIGAPADVGYGKVRAEQGHPKPWLETIRKIHIEIGNEIWTYGGYNKMDYWDSLFARAKASPYYQSNLVCHAGGMFINTPLNSSIIDNTPHADCFSIAPYIGHRYPQNVWNYSPEDRARWVLDYGFEQNFGTKAMAQYEYAKERNLELSIYEVNHHITSVEGDKLGGNRQTVVPESVTLLNEFLPSKISGVSVANNMLLMVREKNTRTQCFFNFNGTFFGIQLWGGVNSLGTQRYKPHWLALSIVNSGIFGSLVETKHSGSNPTFIAPDMKNVEKPSYAISDEAEEIAKKMMSNEKAKRRGGKTKPKVERDCLWSYSFKDGKKRSLIISNIDVLESFPVTLKFKSIPAGAVLCKQLVGDSHLSNNELGHEAEVTIEEKELGGFKKGYKLTVPPASITTIVWTEK